MAKSATSQPAAQQPAAQPPAKVPAAAAVTAIARRTMLSDIPRDSELSTYAFVDLMKGGAGTEVMEAFQANLGGQTLSTFDFTRIKVPSGETRAWQLIDPNTGEQSFSPTVDGVIVAFKDQRAYWEKSLSEQGAVRGPPQCVSFDMVHGRGKPGISCARCPFAQFGSAKTGTKRGQACKQVRFLFVMREGSIMPDVIPVPPTSLQPFRNYLFSLSKAALPYWKVVTRFSLIPDRNAAGTEYSKIGSQPVTILEGDAFALSTQYGAMLRNLLSAAPVKMQQTDIESDEPQDGSGADAAAVEAAMHQQEGASDHAPPVNDDVNRADLI